MSWLFASDGYSVGDSALIPPMSIQGWLSLGLIGLISAVQGTFKSLLHNTIQNHQLTNSKSMCGILPSWDHYLKSIRLGFYFKVSYDVFELWCWRRLGFYSKYHDAFRSISLMPLNCGAREDSWDYSGQQGDWNSQSYRKSTLNIHQKDWY